MKLTGFYNSVSAARIVTESQTAAEFDGVLLDLFTASAIVAAYEALAPRNRDKLAAMPLEQAADIALKLCSKGT